MDVRLGLQVLPEIIDRQTTRSFFRDGKMTEEHIQILLEAACRAPSSCNAQPWRFWYAHHSSPLWRKLFNLLVPANAAWAADSEWLMLVGAASQTVYKDKVVLNSMAPFDVGAACQNMALQVHSMGFGAAVVGGFDRSAAALLINDLEIQPLVLIVLGSVLPTISGARSLRRSVQEVATSSF